MPNNNRAVEQYKVADLNFRCSCGKVISIARGLTEPFNLKFNLQSDATMEIKCECGREILFFVTVNKNKRSL